MCVQVGPAPVKFAQLWPNPSRIRPRLDPNRLNSAEDVGRCGAELDQIRPATKSIKLDQHVARNRPSLAQERPELAQIRSNWPGIGYIRPTLARNRPNLALIRPKLARNRLNSLELGQVWPNFRQIWGSRRGGTTMSLDRLLAKVAQAPSSNDVGCTGVRQNQSWEADSGEMSGDQPSWHRSRFPTSRESLVELPPLMYPKEFADPRRHAKRDRGPPERRRRVCGARALANKRFGAKTLRILWMQPCLFQNLSGCVCALPLLGCSQTRCVWGLKHGSGC